ncbi:MAG: class I mannose-6-phosphate isomerase [Bacteroidales bacterium]|nr:class I mannose-6-phosphate isomerase [Bacteroidales bacterium]
MTKVSYDRFPATKVGGPLFRGWNAIRGELISGLEGPLAVDCYTGADEDEIAAGLSAGFGRVIRTREWMKPEAEVLEMTSRFMTDDVLFGFVSPLRMLDFFDEVKLAAAGAELLSAGPETLIVGPGAALATPAGARLVYADMARWEIQQRFRAHRAFALGVDNREDPVSIQYKRGYFIDWRALDEYKDGLFGRVDFWLDTNAVGDPKLISSATFKEGLRLTVERPFRVVPFFDPAPWGGQWMKRVCGLDPSVANYGWCFDCVPEENSLLFDVDGVLFELPSVDLVRLHSRKLLGGPVEARFGKDFPIRFDFLDTVGGGNLSLQVHPTTQFIREQFGMAYTQDESYYIIDAEEGAYVYLGVKTGIDKDAMISDLRAAHRGELVFDADKYVNKWPASKHNHFLIPGGTIHCSGAGCLVLEISATPNIFTFKLWDWQRLGLDGKPRPINVERGSKVIQWERNTEFAREQLVNHFEHVSSGKDWSIVKTGLHPYEFIETRRIEFSSSVAQNTADSVHVLNLVEGEKAVVESPSGSFEPFEVHYAETFIIPAHLGEYSLRSLYAGECAVMQASVRF